MSRLNAMTISRLEPGPAPAGCDPRADYLAMTRRRRMYTGLIVLIFAALFISGFRLADARNAGSFRDGFGQILDFPRALVLEAWEKSANLPGHILRAIPALIETLNIAIIATLLGCAFGTLLALGATRGLAAWPRLIPAMRRLSDVLRAFPEIVIALVLIFIMGGGPVPATVAIAIHTAGAMGKLFSEVNENVDLKPVEGLRSVGSGWGQQMWLGVFPQVLPNYLSYGLMRLEINIRASAILGFVGAGGIFLTIVAVDQLSSFLRNRLTDGAR